VLAGLVDSYLGRVEVKQLETHKWKCDATQVLDTDVFELKLTCEEAKFAVRPSLFIAVVDTHDCYVQNVYKYHL